MSFLFSSVLNFSPFKHSKGASQEIMRSRDGAGTWEAVGVQKDSEEKELARIMITDIVFEPKNPNTLYLLTEGDGIYKSENSGDTWAALADENGYLSPRATILDIAIEETNVEKIYLSVLQGTRGQVFKTEDGGRHFEEVYVAALEEETVSAVAIDHYMPENIFAGTSSGLLLGSHDQGASWSNVEEFDSGVLDIVINPQDSRHMYVVRGGRIISKTIDKGESWVNLEIPSASGVQQEMSFFPKKEQETFASFSLNPSDPSHLFVVSGTAIFESYDAGATFSEIKTIIPSGSLPIRSFAVDPMNSSVRYVGVESKIYKTVDGAKSWQIKTVPSEASISKILIDPSDSNRVFIVLSK